MAALVQAELVVDPGPGGLGEELVHHPVEPVALAPLELGEPGEPEEPVEPDWGH